MGMSEEQVTGVVLIECPVCCSGNRFRLTRLMGELDCEDCGFVLAEAAEFQAVAAGRCLFCGGEHFYLESPLSLSLLRRDSVCYVCGARYQAKRMENPGQGFSPGTEAEVRGSDVAGSWRRRVERYHQRAG